MLGVVFIHILTLDCIVPPLEGFVMNRVLGDYFENLLYKIFVSIDERITIQQLAEVLQIDIEPVKVQRLFVVACCLLLLGEFVFVVGTAATVVVANIVLLF